MLQTIIPYIFLTFFALWVGVMFPDLSWSYFLLGVSFVSAFGYWNFIEDKKLHEAFKGHPVNIYLIILLICLAVFNFYRVSEKELQDSLNNIEIELHPAFSKNPFDTVVGIRNNGE